MPDLTAVASRFPVARRMITPKESRASSLRRTEGSTLHGPQVNGPHTITDCDIGGRSSDRVLPTYNPTGEAWFRIPAVPLELEYLELFVELATDVWC